MCLFDDKGRGRKNVLPEMFRFREFWVLWNCTTVFPGSLHMNCVWDRLAILQKARITFCGWALRTQPQFSSLLRHEWHCFLVGSGYLLTRHLGSPYLKSRRHLCNFNTHLNQTLQDHMYNTLFYWGGFVFSIRFSCL